MELRQTVGRLSGGERSRAAFAAVTGSGNGRVSPSAGRRGLLGGIVVFTAGSVACTAAPGVTWLIGARAVQGAGAAALLPATLALIPRLFPGQAERERATTRLTVQAGRSRLTWEPPTVPPCNRSTSMISAAPARSGSCSFSTWGIASYTAWRVGASPAT